MAGPIVRFRIDFAEDSSLGPGKIGLLEAIRDSGSLSQGARDIGMSYRRAWLLVESLKQSFREPVTVASAGGKDGGGMLVTEFGDALIESYRELERDFTTLVKRRFHPIIATAVQHSKSGAKGRGTIASTSQQVGDASRYRLISKKSGLRDRFGPR
jgi:molybdate transport system regulatory protein